MKETLPILLQAVLVATVPVCSTFLVHGIRALARYASTKTDNALAKKYLKDAASAITTAVSQTNQTYVDTLKKSGKFTKENQEEALSKALREAVNLMRHETIAFLKEAYGDINDYLVSQIEAEVRKQKLAEPLTLGAPVEAVMEARESPDPVAAASAAATAVARTAVLEAKPAATEARERKAGATRSAGRTAGIISLHVLHSANSDRQSLLILVHGLAGEPVIQWRARGGLRGFDPAPERTADKHYNPPHHPLPGGGEGYFFVLSDAAQGQSLVGVTAPKMQCSR